MRADYGAAPRQPGLDPMTDAITNQLWQNVSQKGEGGGVGDVGRKSKTGVWVLNFQ